MYLIFDTETTGLPKNFEAPHTDLENWPRLVQIAWQLHDAHGKLLSAQNMIVKPVGFTIPYNSEKVHGISTEIALEEGKDLKEVMEIFAEDVAKAEVLIGHNISFDLNITGAEFIRADVETVMWDKDSYDTKSEETATLVAIPGGRGGGFKWPTLTELHKKLFSEGFDDAHDAAYDVAATARCFFGLIEAKVAPPRGEIAREAIQYEAPVLDPANFARKTQSEGPRIPEVFRGKLDRPVPVSHLLVHSQFSILQSTASVKGLIGKAKANGMEAIAFTDLGNMHAAFNAVGTGAKEGVKVIIGSELYVAEERLKKQFTKNIPDRRFTQVLLAKDQEAYQRLSKLCSIGFIEGYYAGYPRIDKQLIKEYAPGMIALSGSLTSEIPKLILNQGEHEAEEAFKWWLDVFGEDFYVCIQRHGLEAEERVNEVMLRFAEKYGVKPLAVHSSFYINQEDSDAHDSLLCVKEGEKKSIPIGKGRGKRLGMPNDDYYFKTQEEMNELFSDVPVALENIQEVIDKCSPIKLKRDILMPRFEMPEQFKTQDEYLRHLSYEGAKEKFGEISTEVEERLDRELGIIQNMGFPGYFLIVQDFINEAKRRGVSVGPGRGSAAGSLVAFCTGITNIDPLKYDLLFERFLNPERVSMPDIDVDFDDEGRQEVINYVVEKYGQNQVAQIITYGTMAAKMSIKDVARVMDLPLHEANDLAKLVPDAPGTKLKDAFANSSEFKEILSHNEEKDLRTKVLNQALILEGSVRGTGIHAAGVIIAPDDLTEYIPVCTSKDADLFVTQFDGKVIEDAGMLKMDFLGLKTLTIIKDAINLIKQTRGVELDMDTIPLDDEKTYELYQRGDTIGTFQFESEGMRMYLKDLKPTTIEDLIAMNALYRPGPLQFIPNFINRKHGKEEVEYPHPLLEPILKNSNGIMVYQEQIMQTAQILAGYTLGGADLLRRAMGKKKIEEMDRQQVIFVEGCEKNHDIPKAKAEEIFEVMKEFAKYGFNRSHSAAYSVVAYQTAYLKANYTPEYMASVLTHNMNNIEKITFFIEECQKLEVEVLGPDINESRAFFNVNAQGQVRFGMAAIKGTGEAAIDCIIEEREKNGPFQDIFDFSRRINLRAVNKKSFESLAYAGAFDSFGLDRALYFEAYEHDNSNFIEKLLRYGNAYQKDKASQTVSLFGDDVAMEIATPPIPEGEPWSRLDKLKYEKEVVGFYVSGHPMEQFRAAMKRLRIRPVGSLANYDRQEILVAGIVGGKQVRQSKNGKMFTIFTLEDFKDSMEIALFGEDHETFSSQIEDNQLVLLTGKVQKNFRQEDRYDLRIRQIQDLTEVQDTHCKGMEVKIDTQLLHEEWIGELEQLLIRFPGEHAFKLKLLDYDEELWVGFTSHKYKIELSDHLVNKLEEMGLECTMVY